MVWFAHLGGCFCFTKSMLPQEVIPTNTKLFFFSKIGIYFASHSHVKMRLVNLLKTTNIRSSIAEKDGKKVGVSQIKELSQISTLTFKDLIIILIKGPFSFYTTVGVIFDFYTVETTLVAYITLTYDLGLHTCTLLVIHEYRNSDINHDTRVRTCRIVSLPCLVK